MDDKMKNEDDNWFEQLLSIKPEITADNFSHQLMVKIEQDQLHRKKIRKNILLASYLFSFVLAAFIMPWSWLVTKFSKVSTLLSNLFFTNTDSQLSVMGFSIVFLISLIIYVFSQETT